MCVIAVC